MKENDDRLLDLVKEKDKDKNIIKVEDKNNIINEDLEKSKQDFAAQDKRFRDKQQAEEFEKNQKQKQTGAQPQVKKKETEVERNARLQKQLEETRRIVSTQMAEKRTKKTQDRKLIRARMLVRNTEFWEELKNDADTMISDEKDARAEKELIEREQIQAKLNLEQCLITQILANAKLMEDPAMAQIMKDMTIIGDLQNQKYDELSEIEVLRKAYETLTTHMSDYIDAHAQDKKKPAGMDHVTELFGLIVEEKRNLNEDLYTWKHNGALPDSIETGADIVARKHIGRRYEDKGRHHLIQTKISILSLKRENGDADSDTMKAVKDSVRTLSNSLKLKMHFNDIEFDEELELVRNNYDEVIKACNTYLTKHKNPHTDDGKERKQAVEKLLASMKDSKISTTAAAKSYKKWNVVKGVTDVNGGPGQFEGARWIDAYSNTDKVSRRVIERIVALDKPGIDLNEEAFQQRQQELEEEMKKLIDAEKNSDAYKKKKEIENYRRRYKPNMNAREFFIKTGIWKDDAKKDEKLKKDEVPVANWQLGNYDVTADQLLASMDDVVTDEEFKAAVIKYNNRIVENDKWFLDPENMTQIRDHFTEHLGDIFDEKKEKDRD